MGGPTIPHPTQQRITLSRESRRHSRVNRKLQRTFRNVCIRPTIPVLTSIVRPAGFPTPSLPPSLPLSHCLPAPPTPSHLPHRRLFLLHSFVIPSLCLSHPLTQSVFPQFPFLVVFGLFLRLIPHISPFLYSFFPSLSEWGLKSERNAVSMRLFVRVCAHEYL